jgi:quaternary ammonium compound-resistance protein SugE
MNAFLSNPLLAWPLVIISILIEVAWFIALKKAVGFSVWPWNLMQVVLPLIDIPLLSYALKSLPAGSVYATWTGSAAALIAIIGFLWLGDAFSVWRLMYILLIIIGIVGLQLTS